MFFSAIYGKEFTRTSYCTLIDKNYIHLKLLKQPNEKIVNDAVWPIMFPKILMFVFFQAKQLAYSQLIQIPSQKFVSL